MDKLCMPSDENFNKLNNSMKFVSENDISVLMEPSRAENRAEKNERGGWEAKRQAKLDEKRENGERQRESVWWSLSFTLETYAKYVEWHQIEFSKF